MKEYKQKILLTISINLVLFVVFLLLCKPVYNTEEDVYILYQLSGSFGSPPGYLLHYNHIIHPLLGFVLKSLFSLVATINWYSVFLLLFHFIACSVILLQLFIQKPGIMFTIMYILLFIVFEGQQLLTINFSNTAIITGSAGLLLLYADPVKQNRKHLTHTVAFILIVAASLFRIHVLVPLFCIALPFLLLRSYPKIAFRKLLLLSAAVCSIFLLNLLHQVYYKNEIPGWQNEEAYRQKIYGFYNNNHLQTPAPDDKWFTEFHLINNGLPIDTAFLSSQKLDSMYIELKQLKSAKQVPVSQDRNWFLINNRIFIITILLLLATFCSKSTSRITTAIAIGGTALGIYFLANYSKAPVYLIIACFSLISLFILLLPGEQGPTKKIMGYAVMAVALLICCWGVVRLYKVNLQNIEGITRFKKAYTEIAKYPDKMFLITDSKFPLQYFYIFDQPKNFMLSNYLGSEHFLQNIYNPVFTRFGLRRFQEIPLSQNILLWGQGSSLLKTYFNQVTGKEVLVSEPIPAFKEGEVRTIIFAQ